MGINFVGQNLTGHHFRMCTSIYLMVSIPESSKPLLSYQTDFYLEIDTCFKIQYVKHVTVTCGTPVLGVLSLKTLSSLKNLSQIWDKNYICLFRNQMLLLLMYWKWLYVKW